MTKYFTPDHEWLDVAGDQAKVGITAYAARQLGDVVFVELPDVGRSVTAGGEAAVVESVKAASEVYAPVDGVVLDVNDALNTQPDLVNSAPEGAGWFFTLTLKNIEQVSALMDAEAYATYLETLG